MATFQTGFLHADSSESNHQALHCPHQGPNFPSCIGALASVACFCLVATKQGFSPPAVVELPSSSIVRFPGGESGLVPAITDVQEQQAQAQAFLAQASQLISLEALSQEVLDLRVQVANLSAQMKSSGGLQQFSTQSSGLSPSANQTTISNISGQAAQGQAEGPHQAQEVKLTTCGATENTGPSQNQCTSAYAGTPASTVLVRSGYQIFTAPFDADVTIQAFGARGGHHYWNLGGFGAVATAQTTLHASERIIVAVGQHGWDNPDNNDGGGGGGGATWVAKEVVSGGDSIAPLGVRVELLAVAGGGAGQNDDANCGEPGHVPRAEGGRGIGGDADHSASSGYSHGGGSFRSSPQRGDGDLSAAQSFLQGAQGCTRVGNYRLGSGFGGGGASYDGGGGGGGYQGGDCLIGGSNCRCHGGTSFGLAAYADVNDGDGFVHISMTPLHSSS